MIYKIQNCILLILIFYHFYVNHFLQLVLCFFVAICDCFCCHSYFGLNGLHLSKAASFSPFERFLLLLCHHFIHTWLTFCWMLGRANTRKLNLLQLVQLMPEDLKRYNGTIHSTFRLCYISNFYVWSSISIWSGIVALTMLLRCS